MTMSYQQPPQAQPPYPPQSHPAAPQQAPRKRRVWLWILGAVVAVFLVAGAIEYAKDPDRTGGTQAEATPTAPATNAKPAEAKAPAKPKGLPRAMSDGVYQVGVDVQAGRYKTPGPAADSAMGMCYWSRNKTDSGEFEAVIANGIVQGPGSVSVKKGEFVELTGGCAWKKVG